MIALQPYLTALPPAQREEAVTESPEPSPGLAERQWEDLALHRARQLVRAEAEAEDHLAGMQERSKVATFLARAM